MLTRGLAVIGVTLVALSGVALAKPKVALITFEGDPKGEAREVVSEALADDTKVVGGKEVNRSIDKLGLDVNDLAEKDLRKLSKELEADAIVQGKLSMKGPNHLLHFKLFVHGKKAKGFKIEFGSLKSAKFKEKLRDKMIAKLGGGDGDDGGTAVKKKGGAGDDDEDPITGKKKKGAGDGDPLTSMKKKGGDDGDDGAKKKGGDEDGGPKSKGPVDVDADDKPRKGKKRTGHRGDDDGGPDVEANSDDDGAMKLPTHSANRVAVRLDVGGSIQKRTLSFTSRSFPQAPNTYTNKPVPGVRVEAEVYPLAFSNPMGVAGGIGLGGMFDQTASLNLTSSAQPGTKFPVTERRYSIGPRFRLVFGGKPTSPSLTIGVGYGHRTFKVNRSGLDMGNTIDLPDVDYVGFDPGLEFRIPLVERVALIFGGSAMLLTSAGPIQLADSYGQAKVTGGQGMGGIDIVITSRIAARITGEFTQVGFAFTGNGAQSNARDMDPTTKDVGGAADRYLGGALTLAVLY